MIPELGHLCLILAFILCLFQAGVPLLQRLNQSHRLMHLTKPPATAGFLLVSGAFAALIYAYATSDFSVLNVTLNSHSDKPLLYKIVGAWGNHEGSMLLWAWVLATCGFLVALLPTPDPELRASTLAVLGAISAGFLGFIIFTSNPFLRIWPIPTNGEDLNPILQDIGLALHPPTLYVGYVGYGVVFAYAIAGLLTGKLNQHWARIVHPWILLPWIFLTLGIGAGSWWAYRELGWGGWWFWDPVENVSLMPWLVGTALLHSNLVLEKRGQLARWVALLAILAFTLSLVGTFIVRSGLLTSVHSFAADPTRGLYILGYIVLVSGSALLVYGFSTTAPSSPVVLLSRGGLILINNLLLLVATAIILLAILYPLALELMKLPGISVGPTYFNRTFLPITAALPLLAAMAPLLVWDRSSGEKLRQLLLRLLPSCAIAVVIALTLFSTPSGLLVIGLALGLWLLWGCFVYLQRLHASALRWRSAAGLRGAAAMIAHLGFAIFILGMTFSATLKQTYEAPITPDKPMMLGEYELRLLHAERAQEHTYTTRRAQFEIRKNGQYITTLSPELRYYTVRSMQTSEASLHSTPLRDLYLVIGESNYTQKKDEATLGVRLYVTPAQQWIWAGFLLTALGGMLSFVAHQPWRTSRA